MSSSLGVGKLKESSDEDDVETDFSRKGEAKIHVTYLNPKVCACMLITEAKICLLWGE